MSYWVYLTVNLFGLFGLTILFLAGLFVLGWRVFDSLREKMVWKSCKELAELGLLCVLGGGFLGLYIKSLVLISSFPIFN